MTGHGGRFRRLAEERLAARFRVVALDLGGHGESSWEQPWTLERHLDDVRQTVSALGIESSTWIGHSFGGRLVMELTARDPDRVARTVLLDPAMWVPPSIAAELGRQYLAEQSFASLDELVETRMVASGLARTPRGVLVEELAAQAVTSEDGRVRYAYSGPAVAAAYTEMARRPPPFGDLGVPTLLVVGELSKIVSGAEVELMRAALGELVSVEVVPGGHNVLWEAFAETADLVDGFL